MATEAPEPKRKRAAAKRAKHPKKTAPAKKAGRRKAERANRKAEVIALMKRAKGAGWQKHTVRGFVSILASQGGEKVESSKNEAGERPTASPNSQSAPLPNAASGFDPKAAFLLLFPD